MCGIHGLTQLDGRAVEPRWLSAMGDVASHRGPDDESQHIESECGIAIPRLSINDLASGDQPFANAEGPAVIVRNGETDKCRDLRDRSRVLGYAFKTGSVSEVLLHEPDDAVYVGPFGRPAALRSVRRRTPTSSNATIDERSA